MTGLAKLSEQMRNDWNRRVKHDYRFWMSDGYQTDEAMWKSGERDFSILTHGIEDQSQKTLLEIGCGVGRLIYTASSKFKQVIGLDISSEAIAKAEDLLTDQKNVDLVIGNGVDLSAIKNSSVDVVISFAAITSTPTAVIAAYLVEIHRVLKPNGIVRLQLYLGKEQVVKDDDTLHLRCFDRDNFSRAVQAAGFEVESIEDLNLPFEVSFKEGGIFAVVVSLRRCEITPELPDTIAKILLPEGESTQVQEIGGREVEYWMALNYARELAEKGDLHKAKETLEYAQAHCMTTTVDVRDLLERIISEIEKKENDAHQAPLAPLSVGDSEFFDKNMRCLSDCFPELYQSVKSFNLEFQNVEVKSTEQGGVIWYRGQCLDHPSKPLGAAEKWARSALAEKRTQECNAIVLFGLGGGYFAEALTAQTEKDITVIEPSMEVLVKALWNRDLTAILPKIKHLFLYEENTDLSPFISESSELFIRPQYQASFPELASKVRSAFYGVRGLSLLKPNIAVLGPLHGGTLPITGYTARGLGELNQRVRTIDMSGFNTGFQQIEGFSNNEDRQNLLRGKYTEMLSELLLEHANEKPFDILISMAQAPINGKALTELRKRGVITVLWFVEDFLRFGSWQHLAQFYDYVFTIQDGECLDYMKKAGAGHAHYLPTACDPMIHAPVSLTAEEHQRWGSEISFVGAGYHNRQQMFASFADLPFKIWGSEWPECKPFDRMVQEKARRLSPEEYVKIFSATDINLNLHSSTERDGVDPGGDFVNPRTFELAASGAFQIVDRRKLLPDLFTEDKEVVCFSDRNELLEKIQYYSAHPKEREKIAFAARERALSEHTYTHRLKQMMSVIYSHRYDHLKRKQDNSPWHKVLRRAEPHPELHRRCEKAFQRGEEATLVGLASDIVSGEGKLTETEQKLLFLFHIRQQTIRMKKEESGN